MSNRQTPHKANPEVIMMWSKRTKCWMCKHRFDKPVILPVDKPERDKFQPNINADVLWHMSDTHGLPPDIVREWIIGSVYGMIITEFGVRELHKDTL